MISYGLSDQTFLVRRRDLQTALLRRPLWMHSPASLWLPNLGGMPAETIIDGYMRRHQRPRLTVLTASTIIAAGNMYNTQGLVERLARMRNIAKLRGGHSNDPPFAAAPTTRFLPV